MLQALFNNWLSKKGVKEDPITITEDPIVLRPKSAVSDRFIRHPKTGRWSILSAYYDSTGELIGFNFYPVSTAGLNELFSHDEGLGLRFNPVDKGILRGMVLALENRGLLEPVVAAL